MSGWSCPDQIEDRCQRMRRSCQPGMPGCILHGQVRFLIPYKDRPEKKRDDRERRDAAPLKPPHSN